jgi:N-acetylmuramoyl-L-alanine amidase
MKIIEHRLCQDDGTPYPFRESPNVGGILKPKYLVMHYTASPSADQAIRWLTNTAASASAHLVIGRDGGITQLVRFDRVAWHAGQSQWNGLTALNNHSIGIEMDNAGPLTRSNGRWTAWFGTSYPPEQVIEAVHKHQTQLTGWQLYTPEQLFTALEVASVLVHEYQLLDVVGHDDIAPGRKSDPGPAFPMDSFRARVFGRGDLGMPDTAPEPAKPVYATTTNLNIRSGPGSSFSTLPGSPLPRGARLRLLGTSGSWYQVDVLDTINGIMDLQGWVHSGYVQQISG